MNKPTIGTYFSGGGIGLALVKDKVDIAFGVEYDPAISEVYRANIGANILTARVQDVDVSKLEKVDLFQVSPVCKEFSNAKVNGKESAEEMGQAAAICAYLDYHKPRYFVLENVRGYVRSKSFQMIVVKLSRLGYTIRQTVENSANYGVPQTRERLILRAALDCPLPSLPDYVGRWVGWYEAIEDLLPGLPESKFADWQLERLPEELKTFLMQIQGEASDYLEPAQPAPTISAGHTAAKYRAFLIAGQNGSNEKVHRAKEGSSFALSAAMHGVPRAFIVDGQPSDNGRVLTVRNGQDPIYTVQSSIYNRPARAFIVGQDSKATTREGKEPLFTLTAEPNREYIRAWLSQGRIVQMTPRALARFQSIPDWYELPQKNGLACCVIGNGVPSLMGQGIIEAMLGIGKEKEEAA